MFGFIRRYKTRTMIYRACLQHAKANGMEKEFIMAYRYNRDSIAALEEWDLYDEIIRERIRIIISSGS